MSERTKKRARVRPLGWLAEVGEFAVVFDCGFSVCHMSLEWIGKSAKLHHFFIYRNLRSPFLLFFAPIDAF